MEFEAGQRVRCINTGWLKYPCRAPTAGPRFDACCTVVAVSRPQVNGAPLDCVALAEFPGELFAASGFAPIEDYELGKLRALIAAPQLSPAQLRGDLA